MLKAQAKQLPSGSWRCQVFAGYTYEGGKKKRKYESFTANERWEAEMQASQWLKTKGARPENMTVKSAVEQYIESKKPVLSPSTIRGYNVCAGRFTEINDLKLSDLRTSNVQPWISNMSLDLSWKTVQNTYGLLTAVLDYFSIDPHLKIRLPSKRKTEYRLPSDADIATLLERTKGTQLWTAIMLARYYGLRRSEICALDKTDLRGDVLTVRKACVMNESGKFVIKETPKTYNSHRKLTIADPLLKELKAGRFVEYNPGILSDRFRAELAEAKITPFNFHLLRHVFASKAAIMGIPDFYVAKMGGWEPGSAVLKQIYQNVETEELDVKMKQINEAMQHELQHK